MQDVVVLLYPDTHRKHHHAVNMGKKGHLRLLSGLFDRLLEKILHIK